jgi:DNA-binding CsgD family transcriptional regulator
MLNNPCFEHIDDIAEITAQYFNDLNLHFFGHITVYPDGRFSFLCSGQDWPRASFHDQKMPPVGFTIYDKIGDQVLFPSMEKGDAFGWTDEITLEAKQRFGILNPMLITRKYNDHFEAYFFDLHCENVYEKYIHLFGHFEQFIHYHKDRSNKIIKKVSENLLVVDDRYLPVDKKIFPTELRTITASSQARKYFLHHNDADITVTAREYQCMALLAHGRQFKSVADELKLSTRTIETHIDRIKTKLNLFSREEIAAVYWNNRIVLGN